MNKLFFGKRAYIYIYLIHLLIEIKKNSRLIYMNIKELTKAYYDT
jgi:hypothetical protein